MMFLSQLNEEKYLLGLGNLNTFSSNTIISFSVCCNALGKNKEVMRCCCYLVPLFLGTPFAAECSGECPGNCWVFVVFLLLL